MITEESFLLVRIKVVRQDIMRCSRICNDVKCVDIGDGVVVVVVFSAPQIPIHMY